MPALTDPTLTTEQRLAALEAAQASAQLSQRLSLLATLGMLGLTVYTTFFRPSVQVELGDIYD